jgi:hypothetical protein
MAEKKFFVNVDLQGNFINNLKADTLDITTNSAASNTKRIAYYNGQYYYSNGTTWIALSGSGNLPAGGAEGQILAKASATDYDAEWIENYTSTVKHEVKAGVALSKGQAVYVSSADGTNMIVSKASNTLEATSSKTMGLVASSAALNDIIFVITEGLLTGTGGEPLDTSSANAGDPVWLGTNGNLLFGLANKPVAPAHLVFIGIVTRSSATVGEIFVKVQNGYELGEIHDVLISSPVSGQILKLDSDSLWKNWTPNFITGSGTTNYITKFTASGVIGNSVIQDDGTNIGVGIAPQTGSRLYVGAGANTGVYSAASTAGKNAVYGSNIGDGAGNRIAAFFESYPSDTPINTNIYVAGRFYADGPFAYAVQLQDASEGVGKFLKCVTIDGKANWATMSVADTGLTLTTTGTNGAATLVGNTLNIPTYESSLIPKLQGNEIWRGHTFRNNSTTFDSTAGLTLSTTGTNTARSVATTSYAARGIRMGITASIVATGRYTGIRGSVLLWYVTGGFLYTGEFNISDTATAAGTHNFWGLASSTSDLVIGDIANSQPSALTNIIAFANDSGDANLQIMYNDATGTATKTDLGSSFPSNRTAGAAITTIYSCYLYNAPGSTNVIYRIVNKETGAVAQGTLSSNLPASTVGLNFFGVRTMGTSAGGVTNSGQFDVYRLGVYSL